MAAPLSTQIMSRFWIPRALISRKLSSPNSNILYNEGNSCPVNLLVATFSSANNAVSMGASLESLLPSLSFGKSFLLHPRCSRSTSSSSSSRSVLRVKDLSKANCCSTLLAPTANCTLEQIRPYGRKVRQKPPKISHFEYSGDLRTIPEMDKETRLYSYRDLEDQIEQDEVTKKLTSFEFASSKERRHHKEEVIRDRIVELFGPNSELEQEIAVKTLKIRETIPYCIQNRSDKKQKIILLKRIFGRRDMLGRLRQMDHQRFEWLLRELKIRYVIPQDRQEYQGWKHNLKVATEDESTRLQRQKLEELKVKFEQQKEEFAEHKKKVLAQMERDLEAMGLDCEELEKLLVAEKETLKPHKILTWPERVKLGMTGKIKDYYG